MVRVHLIGGLFACAIYAASVESTSAGFPNLDHIKGTPGLIPEPVSQFGVRQWLFPSIKFTSNANITRWIFRAAVGQGPGFDNGFPELPLMHVWRNKPSNQDDYNLVGSSGGEEELVGDGPVYEYVLQSPVEVQEIDVFGIFYPYTGDERLQLLFSDLGDGGAPTSYRRSFDHSAFETPNADPDTRYVPLVTAVLGNPSGTTIVLPFNTQSTSKVPFAQKSLSPASDRPSTPTPTSTSASNRLPSSTSVSSSVRQSRPPPTFTSASNRLPSSTSVSPPVRQSRPPPPIAIILSSERQPTHTPTTPHVDVNPSGRPELPIVIGSCVGAVVLLMLIIIAALASICIVKHTRVVEVTANEAYGLQPVARYDLKENEAYGLHPQTSTMQSQQTGSM